MEFSGSRRCFYNAVSFGNPFLNSYMAGGYPESMLQLNLSNSFEKVRLYLAEITLYVPIVWLGILGLLFFPRNLRREQVILVVLLMAQMFQVLNIESHGGCHYGPRFLLPAMPFLCVGLAGFDYLRSGIAKRLAMATVMLAGLVSIFISTLGAMYTAMYCDVGQYGLWAARQNLGALTLKDFPMVTWLAPAACVKHMSARLFGSILSAAGH